MVYHLVNIWGGLQAKTGVFGSITEESKFSYQKNHLDLSVKLAAFPVNLKEPFSLNPAELFSVTFFLLPKQHYDN